MPGDEQITAVSDSTETMAKESTIQSCKTSVVPETLHKSSGSAVPGTHLCNTPLDPEGTGEWYVAILDHQKYTDTCCEYITKRFQEQHCTCYVPCKQEMHVYANRTKRMVTKYVIPRFIFVTGISENQAYTVVPEWPHVSMFLPDRARARVYGRLALAKVMHRDLLKLKHVIDNIPSADDVTFSPDQLQFDEQIKVVRGDLKGLEGGYYKSDDNDYLVFMLGKLGNIKVRVSIRDCALK